MRRAVCPGSFDPVTHGHIDVITRAARLFDEVIVAVGVNPSKRTRLFTPDERIAMLRETFPKHSNVRVESFTGLLIDFCAAREASVVVKGVRASGDVDYEVQMAQMNAALAGVETVFLPTSPQFAFVSSSLVKEVALLGGDVSAFVPAGILRRLTVRLAESAGD